MWHVNDRNAVFPRNHYFHTPFRKGFWGLWRRASALCSQTDSATTERNVGKPMQDTRDSIWAENYLNHSSRHTVLSVGSSVLSVLQSSGEFSSHESWEISSLLFYIEVKSETAEPYHRVFLRRQLKLISKGKSLCLFRFSFPPPPSLYKNGYNLFVLFYRSFCRVFLGYS